MTGTERRQRIWAASMCAGVALFIAYAVWLDEPGFRVPPVIGYLAARTGSVLSALMALLVVQGVFGSPA